MRRQPSQSRQFNRGLQQLSAQPIAAPCGMDDHVFQQSDLAAAGGADGEQQVDHADDPIVLAQHEYAPDFRVFDDLAQAGGLFAGVRLEVGFLGEQEASRAQSCGNVSRRSGGDLGSLLRPEALVVIAARRAARRAAGVDAFAFAQLFVEEFLPFHVADVFCGEGGEVAVEQGGERLAVGQAEVLPEVVAAHAGGGDEVGDIAVVFVGDCAMVEQQLQQVGNSSSAPPLPTMPCCAASQLRGGVKCGESDTSSLANDDIVQSQRRDEGAGVRIAVGGDDPGV